MGSSKQGASKSQDLNKQRSKNNSQKGNKISKKELEVIELLNLEFEDTSLPLFIPSFYIIFVFSLKYSVCRFSVGRQDLVSTSPGQKEKNR